MGRSARASREIIAKVGSPLNQRKTAPMAKIDEGQDVEIIGDQDEYWKINPPQGSVLYVNQAFVDPLKALPTIAESGAVPPAPRPVAPHADKPATPPAGPNEGTAVAPDAPAVTETPGAAAAPTTAPSEVAVNFDKLEADFKIGNEKPITDQPIDSLLSGYEAILKQDSLTERMRKIAEVRVSTLKLRAEAKSEFVAAREAQELAAERQKSLQAEHDEIKDRLKQQEVAMYAAIGTLRPSSIQRGGGTLYRLTDPATGRTVAYLRTSDTKYASLLGQFIGIKGKITIDTALNNKIIENPADAQTVDPAKVNTTVAAQIIPPSLMSLHASTTPE